VIFIRYTIVDGNAQKGHKLLVINPTNLIKYGGGGVSLKRSFKMKNVIKSIGFIAFVAVIGLGLFAGCADPGDPTDIIISGIDATYNGKYASGGVSDSKGKVVALGIQSSAISGGTVKWEMQTDKGKDIVLDGRYTISLFIGTDLNTTQGINSEGTWYVYNRRLGAGEQKLTFAEFTKITN
jgi:hypothetical protein